MSKLSNLWANRHRRVLNRASPESVREQRRVLQYDIRKEVFPEGSIVATLSRQLGWSHFKELLPLNQPLQRDFYAEMCWVERWSVRTLRDKIGSMLYERTAISKKPEDVAKAELAALRSEDQLTPDLVFRDPYILDFLGLKDRYLEKDLEDAILRELLQQKLHTAIEISRARLEAKERGAE